MTKTDWPYSIARKAVLAFDSYSARGGSTDALHLDANENPYAPPPVTGVANYNRYPEQQPPALRQRLADIYGTKPERILVGRGADEGIEILLRTFCEDGQDSILICPPTFGYYKTVADIQGAKTIEVPLSETYEWDVDGIHKAASETKKLKAIFICSPNNPTGNEITRNSVLELARAFPDTFIVVDEAYIEFSESKSFIDDITDYPNLVVLRTLSKAYALAGVRGGCAIADERVIELMLKVLPPYPIARPVEKAILSALAPAAMGVHAERLTETLEERERMAKELKKSPFVKTVYPSAANFLLLEVKEDEGLIRELSKRAIKIRDYRSTTGRMRISIGSPAENTLALKAFGVVADDKAERVGETFRTTKETDIAVRVNLDDTSKVEIETGLGFFDHMLEQIAKHGGMGLRLTCKGDLEIDAHHTVEDTALAFGEALRQALGNKAGIGRYGFVMPMDETQAKVAIDLSGRPAAVFKGTFPTDHIGEFPVEMCPHFFESLAQSLGAAIHIDVQGDNSHHIVEACFKGVGRALRPAFAKTGTTEMPSTKGMLA
ncbi:histidinol-phosphate transaminase [Litorimonas haliclonae]|uniref:histidinol-phosphate transaminase n=1 Tax=Litorimonas haliclonae TaxID=2081977 RepID=UPI0039F0B9C6